MSEFERIYNGTVAELERRQRIIDGLQEQLKAQELVHRQERERLALHDAKMRGDYWIWQGNEDDHLESMVGSCPVMITAGQLKELVYAPEISTEIVSLGPTATFGLDVDW